MKSFIEYINDKESLNEATFNSKSLNEATFNSKRLKKVAELYAGIMSKKLSGEFKNLGVEEYKRKRGNGKGYRFINNSGEMLRFNWDSKISKNVE